MRILQISPGSIAARGLLAGALLLGSGAILRAQERLLPPGARRGAVPPPAAVQTQPGRAAALPPGWIEQLQELTPAEQERFLRNNVRFRNLPPQQQALIRSRLRAWNSLPLEQRQALIQRQQVWEQLPQEQRRQVRESLLPRWQILPAPRRQAILGRLRELRDLDEDEREARLSDESFAAGLSAEERQMLRDLAALGVGQAPD